MLSGRHPKLSAGTQGLGPAGVSSFRSPLSSDCLACAVHLSHVAFVSYLRHASFSRAFLSVHPVVFYAHSHLLHLGTSCLILKASSDLTSSAKPSLVVLGRVCGFLFLPFFSYVTAHVFVTVCQLAYLYWEFPVFDTWLCPQQDQHSCLEQPCRIC